MAHPESVVRPQDFGIGTLFETVRDAVIVAEASTGRIVLWNPAATEIFGYSPSEALDGLDVEALVPDRLKERHRAGLSRYRDTGHGPYIDSHTVLDLPALRRDGEEIRIEMSLSPIKLWPETEAEGRFVLAVVREVTQRKEAEQALEEGEKRLRVLFENSSDLISLVNPDNTIRYVSPSVRRMLGYEPEELEGTLVSDLVHPEDFDGLVGKIVEQMQSGIRISGPVEARYRHKDGSWRHLETTLNVLIDDPSVEGVVCSSRDITERRRGEEEIRKLNEELEDRVAERTARLEAALADLKERERGLRESKERYEAVVEQAGEGIFLFDPETKLVLESNPAFRRTFGYDEEELRRITLYDLVPQDPEGVDRNVERALEERHLLVGERRYRRKDGSAIDVEVSGGVISYGGEEVICSVVRDVTERRRAEEDLRTSEERFRSMVEQSIISIQILSPDGRTIKVNRAWEELFGLTADDLEGYNLLEDHQLVDKGAMPHILKGFAGEAAAIPPIAYVPDETLPGAADHGGQERWIRAFVYPVKDDAGSVQEVVLMHEDVTERRRAEEALRQSEKRLQDILDNSPAVVYVKDLEGRYVLVNRRFEDLFQVQKNRAVGKTDHDLFPKEAADDFRANDEEVLRSGLPLEIEETAPQDDGSHAYLSVKFALRGPNGAPYAVCGISTDITERKRVEDAMAEVRETERNRMARDLHDGALQDLSYALAEAQILKVLSEDPNLDDRLDRQIEALKRSSQGVREAVYGLLPAGAEDRPLSQKLGSLVEESRRMSPGCDIRLEFEEGFPSDLVSGGGMEVLRIVQEALSNARKHSGAENVLVSLRTEGNEFVAEVSDDGRGFEPGTRRVGVGLRSMNERAAALGGELEVESESGKGTRVRFTAPLRNVGGGGTR